MADDKWGGEKGGFDNFVLRGIKARFGFHEKYQDNEKTCLILTGDAHLPEGKVVEDSDQFFGVGAFDAVDGGARARHESGDDSKVFHASSGFIALFEAAIECGVPMKDRCKGDPMNMREASIWDGLDLRFERIKTGGTYTDREGNEKESTRLLPVEWMNPEGGAPSSTQAGSASTNGANSSGSLEDLVAKHDDQMKFIDEAVKAGFGVTEADAAWKAKVGASS